MTKLSARLAKGEIVTLDGATSTEIQSRGVALDEVCWRVTSDPGLALCKSGTAISAHGLGFDRIW